MNRTVRLRELAAQSGAMWCEVNFFNVTAMFGGVAAADQFVKEVRAFDRSITIHVYPEGLYVRVKMGLG